MNRGQCPGTGASTELPCSPRVVPSEKLQAELLLSHAWVQTLPCEGKTQKE